MAESLEKILDHINTPQFFDFNKVDNDENDENGYFEQEHELSDPLYTSNYFADETLVYDQRLHVTNNFRRSRSYGDLNELDNFCKLRSGKVYRKSDHFEDNLAASTSRYTENTTRRKSDEFEDNLADSTSQYTENTTRRKSDEFEDNSPAASTSRYSRALSKENLSRLAQPKRIYGSEQNLSRNEYVPMAEAVNKFQRGTPRRFRSKPNLSVEPLHMTIPHSPKLKTSIRSRPVPDYVLSQTQKEQLEIEEAKKCQFKANPMNKKIFKSPVMNKAVKKTTVAEPFKLTAPPKKIGPSPIKKATEFHARPMPKYVYEPQIPTIKAPLRSNVTKPNTPSFMRHIAQSPKRSLQGKIETTQTHQQLKPTIPVPFSFENRDKSMMSKKEQLIQRVLETEKRAREFHAKPVPKSILQPTRAFSLAPKNKADDTINTTMNTTSFRAKPPSVLYKKPFEPKLEKRPLLEIGDFVLNTDVRFREREQFEQMVKDKEHRLMMLRRQEELTRKREEAEEIQRVRKNAEFKAQEIKKYKEMVIKPSLKLTQPISPKFVSNKTKNSSSNKENTS